MWWRQKQREALKVIFPALANTGAAIIDWLAQPPNKGQGIGRKFEDPLSGRRSIRGAGL
jgi:hypothetical protein